MRLKNIQKKLNMQMKHIFCPYTFHVSRFFRDTENRFRLFPNLLLLKNDLKFRQLFVHITLFSVRRDSGHRYGKVCRMSSRVSV